MPNNIEVGYARVNVTPPLGVNLDGYAMVRIADGVLDELEATAIALRSSDTTAVLIAVDHTGLYKVYLDEWRANIAARLGIGVEGVFIHCSHTHTAPQIVKSSTNPLTHQYAEFLERRLSDVAKMAVEDLAPARMGIGTAEAKNVAFIRRYRMKDGSVKTNPGVNNPDILHSIGDTDESVSVVRFDREGKETIIVANFGNHPDVVGGCKISADWPGMTRRFVEKAIDGTRCIFFNGAEGDVNHVNVHPKAGDFNDMFNDFDGCSRGYGHARHIARVITGAIMSVYDKVEYIEADSVRCIQRAVDIEANKADPADLPWAREIMELHNSGRDDMIPYKAMMLTTVIARAARMIRLENAPDVFPLPCCAISVGDVAFFGIPGEPFTGIGRGLKAAEGWKMVIPCCITNGREGYFPMRDSYDEGGYEAGHSNFKAGSAEKFIDEGLKILRDLWG